jgi:hypothetical protein
MTANCDILSNLLDIYDDLVYTWIDSYGEILGLE